jgi:hypothetical protein
MVGHGWTSTAQGSDPYGMIIVGLPHSFAGQTRMDEAGGSGVKRRPSQEGHGSKSHLCGKP